MSKLIFICFFHSICNLSLSQDILTTIDGKTLECKVLEIEPPKLKYRLKSQPNGPVRIIQFSNILKVKYADGTEEVFNEKTEKKINSNNDLKKSVEMLREFRTFSIGFSPNFIASTNVYPGGMFCLGLEMQPVPFRFLLDASATVPDAGFNYYTFNLNLQYVFRLAKGKIELFTELGGGIYHNPSFYRYKVTTALINIGAGLDYRFSNLFSIYFHPRFQIAPAVDGVMIFTLNLGARFRFGSQKKK